ncbi:lipoprotein [Pseudoalteromonas obscura]|uniref:Lipoprotein n=1 Tax=Pseudoalteromonas obscura TaxID=3048491 RepID=A0ABT7ELY7_9GAMM|nr:lipoprotein [Pseudoalteromonas sp. P94(2023)]MDK2596071.1 lipoprotein [Pseudoalteromonas sp. P94(2023)]
MKKYFVTALAVTILSGCASVEMQSYVDPQFKTTQYSSFLVDAAIADLTLKTLIEDRVCKQINLNFSEVKCVKAIDTFSPTREYNQQTWQQAFAKTGAQARLQIELLSQESQASHTFTANSAPSYSPMGTPSTNYTSYTTVHLTDKFQITLFDKGDQNKAMTATGVVKAQKTFRDHNKTIASMLSERIAQELLYKGLVKQPTPVKL